MNSKKQSPKQKLPRGGQLKYSKALVDKICFAIQTNVKSLKRICEDDEQLPCFQTVHRWLNDEKKEFDYLRDSYVRAKKIQLSLMADEIIDISDDDSEDVIMVKQGGKLVPVKNKEFVERSKLKSDNRKWLLSKLDSKKFGDKLDVTSGGTELVINITGGGKKEGNS